MKRRAFADVLEELLDSTDISETEHIIPLRGDSPAPDHPPKRRKWVLYIDVESDKDQLVSAPCSPEIPSTEIYPVRSIPSPEMEVSETEIEDSEPEIEDSETYIEALPVANSNASTAASERGYAYSNDRNSSCSRSRTPSPTGRFWFVRPVLSTDFDGDEDMI
jgi:hypothetical protein